MIALAKSKHGPATVLVRAIECPIESRRHRLRDSDRHNPFGFAPSTNDVIALGLKLSGFFDPQTLTHATPTFDSRPGKSNRRLESLTLCDRNLTSVKFTAPLSHIALPTTLFPVRQT